MIYKCQYNNFLYLFKKLQCKKFFLKKKTYINKNKILFNTIKNRVILNFLCESVYRIFYYNHNLKKLHGKSNIPNTLLLFQRNFMSKVSKRI
jgi:hypothetical protein